jgi:hypothetical protein
MQLLAQSSNVSPIKFDLDVFFTKQFGLLHFLLWGNNGHEYYAFCMQFFARVSKTLRMISGTGTHHSAFSCSFDRLLIMLYAPRSL